METLNVQVQDLVDWIEYVNCDLSKLEQQWVKLGSKWGLMGCFVC
jgi:hypothetical protein